MIRRNAALVQALLMAADALVAIVVLVAAVGIRFRSTAEMRAAIDASIPDPRLAAAAFVATWIGLLWARGLYRSRSRWTLAGDLRDVLGAAVMMAMLTLSALFLFKLPDVSRLLLVLVFPFLVVGAFAPRVALRLALLYLRRDGRHVRNILVVGTNTRATTFASVIESHPDLGLAVIGHLTAGTSDNGVHLDRPLLGSVADLETILHTRIVDEVAICLPFAMEDLIEQVTLLCQQEGKVVLMPAAPLDRLLSLGRVETIDGLSVYSLTNGPDRAVGLLVKRVVDIAGSAVLLVVLAPFLLLLAVLVKLDSDGPALFRQDRVGLHGRSFALIKFRTMSCDAEEKGAELRAQNEIEGQAFKLEHDPRITRFGRFLRKTSLDELPQLWNVLFGQMSLVGPRPPLPGEVADYDIWHRRRLSMKPGMTGLWQVGARRERDFDQWVEKDLEYIDGWSLWLDFKIMARTVPAILSGEGR